MVIQCGYFRYKKIFLIQIQFGTQIQLLLTCFLKTKKKFHLNFPEYQILKNNLSEFFIFLNSGGVVQDTFYIPLNKLFLNFFVFIDKILVSILPSIFALNRSIVLKKIK